jgi:hypothetical protein
MTKDTVLFLTVPTQVKFTDFIQNFNFKIMAVTARISLSTTSFLIKSALLGSVITTLHCES